MAENQSTVFRKNNHISANTCRIDPVDQKGE